MGQIGKFNAYGAHKAYARENLQLLSYPTVLFFPKNRSQIIKYPSENRKVDALLGFVQALQ
jgi:adenylyl-sulfate reductase (glutathione)